MKTLGYPLEKPCARVDTCVDCDLHMVLERSPVYVVHLPFVILLSNACCSILDLLKVSIRISSAWSMRTRKVLDDLGGNS